MLDDDDDDDDDGIQSWRELIYIMTQVKKNVLASWYAWLVPGNTFSYSRFPKLSSTRVPCLAALVDCYFTSM